MLPRPTPRSLGWHLLAVFWVWLGNNRSAGSFLQRGSNRRLIASKVTGDGEQLDYFGR